MKAILVRLTDEEHGALLARAKAEKRSLSGAVKAALAATESGVLNLVEGDDIGTPARGVPADYHPRVVDRPTPPEKAQVAPRLTAPLPVFSETLVPYSKSEQARRGRKR